MRRRLTLVFALIFLAIAAVTGWASSQMAFWRTPAAVVEHPWFIATLTDAYLAFFTFWLWVAYKETSWIARAAWLLLIFVLGNLAMAAYVVLELKRLPPGASIEDLLLRRRRWPR